MENSLAVLCMAVLVASAACQPSQGFTERQSRSRATLEATVKVTSAHELQVTLSIVNREATPIRVCSIGWVLEVAGRPSGGQGQSVHCDSDAQFVDVQPRERKVIVDASLPGSLAVVGEDFRCNASVATEKDGPVRILEATGSVKN